MRLIAVGIENLRASSLTHGLIWRDSASICQHFPWRLTGAMFDYWLSIVGLGKGWEPPRWERFVVIRVGSLSPGQGSDQAPDQITLEYSWTRVNVITTQGPTFPESAVRPLMYSAACRSKVVQTREDNVATLLSRRLAQTWANNVIAPMAGIGSSPPGLIY